MTQKELKEEREEKLRKAERKNIKSALRHLKVKIFLRGLWLAAYTCILIWILVAAFRTDMWESLGYDIGGIVSDFQDGYYRALDEGYNELEE